MVEYPSELLDLLLPKRLSNNIPMDETEALLAPETDIESVQEALFAQQRLLQQLYTELDEEREASSSAASEALSMILRLQGEKASLKMEASQYKRMAEEKMYHAEESLDSFEDLIYQRELEIASLEFQVQAYRYRLVSMGCSDLGDYENKFPENLLIQGSTDNVLAESRGNSNMRRLKSLPQLFEKESSSKKTTIERKKSVADLFPRSLDDNAGCEVNDFMKKAGSSGGGGDLNAYWQQIKKLDEKVKEISEGKDGRKKGSLLKGGTWSPSMFSQVSIDLPGDSDQLKPQEHAPEKLPFGDFSRTSSLHDIFEVPQIVVVENSVESQKKDHQKLVLEGENRLRKPDPVAADMPESSIGSKPGSIKAMMVSPSHEKKLPKSMSGECSLPPKVNVAGSQNEYQRLSRRIEKLERERRNIRQELTAEGEVEMNLLKGIHEQLIELRADIQSWKSKKWSWFPDNPPLDPLREAMLHFWC